MRIEPARLASLLQTLRNESKKTTETDGKSASVAASAKGKVSRRDPSILRSRLREKLLKLKADNTAYDQLAPTITIQEILAWEFGNMVLEYPDFHKVVGAVTDTMQRDPRLAASMALLIAELSN